jgi:hypothetical protein
MNFPFFEQSWNRKLVFFATCNWIYVGIYFVSLVVEYRTGPFNVDYSSGDQVGLAWLAGFWIFFLILTVVLISTLTLWISMWVYWARAKSLGWFVALLFGPMFGSLAFYHLKYREELQRKQRLDAAISAEKERMANAG